MSTTVLQNLTTISGKSEPMLVIIQYDSNNIFLAPTDEHRYNMRRMIVAEPKTDRRGLGEKDVNGNVIMTHVAHTVIIEDPDGLGQRAWKRCPESLYRALEAGTYPHCYKLGKKAKVADLEQQDWYKKGMSGWYMAPFTPEVGVHIGRAEDAMAILEAKLAAVQQKKELPKL